MRRVDLATWFLGRLGFGSLARWVLVRKGRFALNFHGVSSRRYLDVPLDLQPFHSAADFRQTLTWLSNFFSFLSVEEFLFGTRPGILLTFDDGHANNLTNVLPILAEFRVQGLFFVATQHVQTPRNWLSFTRDDALRNWDAESAVPDDFARDCYDGLSESQLMELGQSPWAIIGAHTVSHLSLPICSPEQLQCELVDSRDYLEKVIKQRVNFFAYPYGNYNRRVAEAVKEAGYHAAFAVDPLPVGLPSYEIPRIGLYAANPDYLNVKLSGLHRRALRGPALNWSADE